MSAAHTAEEIFKYTKKFKGGLNLYQFELFMKFKGIKIFNQLPHKLSHGIEQKSWAFKKGGVAEGQKKEGVTKGSRPYTLFFVRTL